MAGEESRGEVGDTVLIPTPLFWSCAGKTVSPTLPYSVAGFGVNVVDQPIVHDGNFTTSTSPATAMEVAFSLLAELTGEKAAEQIRHMMGFNQERA